MHGLRNCNILIASLKQNTLATNDSLIECQTFRLLLTLNHGFSGAPNSPSPRVKMNLLYNGHSVWPERKYFLRVDLFFQKYPGCGLALLVFWPVVVVWCVALTRSGVRTAPGDGKPILPGPRDCRRRNPLSYTHQADFPTFLDGHVGRGTSGVHELRRHCVEAVQG